MENNAPNALVVDDDVMILFGACDILAEAGFRPLEAMNVDEAIARLEQHADEITLLFTDVDMPGDRWPHIAIVIASGAREPQAGEIPAAAIFVRKPFGAQVIHNRLNDLLPDGQKPEPLKRIATS